MGRLNKFKIPTNLKSQKIKKTSNFKKMGITTNKRRKETLKTLKKMNKNYKKNSSKIKTVY
jgi:hypothetical protein